MTETNKKRFKINIVDVTVILVVALVATIALGIYLIKKK